MDIYDDPIAKALNLTPLSNSLLIAIEEEINLIKKLTTIAPSLNAGKTYEELYGEERARELKLSHSESQKKYVCSEQTKEKLRKANKKQFDDPIKRKIHLDSFLLNNGNHKNTVWVNNGIKSPSDWLLLANIYQSSMEGYNYKLKQITNYEWLYEEMINKFHNNISRSINHNDIIKIGRAHV